jgi:YARHG domain
MGASKIKAFTYSLSVIAFIGLAGCNKINTEAQAPVAKTALETSHETTPSTPTLHVAEIKTPENLSHVGLYTGQFSPSLAYNKAETAYDVWKIQHEDELEYDSTTELKKIPVELRPYVYADLYGYYWFMPPNRLSIIIDEINENNTFRAHSVAAGNEREVKGKWEKMDGQFRLIGNEPGNQDNDGTFDMILDKNSLTGTWTSFDDNSKSKEFKLTKTEFRYDPNGTLSNLADFGRYSFDKNPSLEELKANDVENLTKQQLSIISNFIFARHGYSFNKKNIRMQFEGLDWYIPVSTDIKADLTDIEKKNLMLLKRYNRYAEDHYDDFGR